MRKNHFLYPIMLFLINIALALSGCADPRDSQSIVSSVISAHGGERYQSSIIEFDFRGRHFQVERSGGLFTYQRTFEDTAGAISDVLNNQGFCRKINGEQARLSEREKTRFSSSVNSVVYFALLPYSLNDQAVQKRYLGTSAIKGEPYHKIEVSFQKEGGGKDYSDVFTYWFHQEKLTLDYLAYRFHRDGGGTRFREAFNQRRINGILFADYHNYKGAESDTSTVDYDQRFEAGQLAKVSEVILENIDVKILK
ncbi:MAG: DUF6503 family protein [bacterium]